MSETNAGAEPADSLARSQPSAMRLRRRPDLMERMEGAWERRLTALTAPAGFGKTTLLELWSAGRRCARYTLTPSDRSLATLVRGIVDALRLRVPRLPGDIALAVEGARGPDAAGDEESRAEAYAALLCDALQDLLPRHMALVLDDAHEIAGSVAPARLIEGLCRQAPSRLHVVVACRGPLPLRVERLRGKGEVGELNAAHLVFTLEETAALAEDLGVSGGEVAQGIHEITRGWPVAVRLAVEALRDVPPGERAAALTRIPSPAGPLFGYLAEEVIDRESPNIRKLLRLLAPLDRFSPGLIGAIGGESSVRALTAMGRRGLYLEPAGEPPWMVLTPLVRTFIADRHPLAGGDLSELQGRAASWFEQEALWDDALEAILAADDKPRLAAILEHRGPTLLTGGSVEPVIKASAALPAEARSAAIDRLEGEARQVLGDWEGALACFRREVPETGPIPPGVAWRLALIHHLRGRLDEAMAVYERGDTEADPDRDVAMLLAWHASALWLRGEAERCRELAGRALRLATELDDPQSLAASHTVMAMLAAMEGDRAGNEAHYLRALDHAERAGDVLQLIRIRVNHASHHMEEGFFDEAASELEVALRLADLAGFASFRALALNNRGQVHLGRGRLEEAVSDLEAGRDLYERIGSRMLSYPLAYLGEVYRERGEMSLARSCYEEALRMAEQAGDVQGLVPALSGLAMVLVEEDPQQAAALAERALATGPSLQRVSALLAAAAAAAAQGDEVHTAALADQAVATARGRRDRPGLVDALLLMSTVVPQEEALQLLREAEALAIDLDSPLRQARAEVAIARLIGGSSGVRVARGAARTFAALGARRQAAEAHAVADDLERFARPPLALQTLGGFQVLRHGDPVPVTEWQSRKARDLLKLLVVRRGRPMHREALIDVLWGGEDPERVANRLSVALSTVRNVLDPERLHPPDHFVRGERTTVALATDRLVIDVEDFLVRAGEGLEALRGGDEKRAREALVAAESAYVGDFMEEDVYEDWAVGLREETRATYIEVTRALADLCAAAGDHDGAARYCLRLLERDAYDERAHLGLVSSMAAAGRHGEARRLYGSYCVRMAELDVEAAPFPGPSIGAP